MLIEGLVALGSALEAWRRKSAMICWRSANLLSGVGHICAPRRDRPCGRIIPRSTRATTCSPVRRISLACRMSAKDLTRQAHRRFAKVRSRRNSATLAGRSTNVEDCPKRDLSGQGVNIGRLLFALTQARGEDGTHPDRLQLNQASRSLQTHLRPCAQNRSGDKRLSLG